MHQWVLHCAVGWARASAAFCSDTLAARAVVFMLFPFTAFGSCFGALTLKLLRTPYRASSLFQMQFKRFDPGSCKLATPRVSALPTICWEALAWFRKAPIEAVGFQRQRAYMRSRYALTDAYGLCGVGPSGALLAPAYHCRTMLDPALRLGAECRLYPLEPDLSVNVAAIDRLLTEAEGHVAALLATHFFGFAQDFHALADCCRRHGVHLIEDCSHVLPALGAGGVLGSFGRYSVWSPYKFYPCEDGGHLQANGDARFPDGSLKRQSPLDEAKGLVRLMRRSRKVVTAADLGKLADQLAPPEGAGVLARGSDVEELSGTPSGDYRQTQERLTMSQASRWIVRHADGERIKSRRRQRYLQWLDASARWPHCRPLHSALPDDCVPYMFPLRIEHPEAHFLPLKRIGVPVWRWDSMAVSQCPVATDYRLHMFQLPCHQELNDAEMSWMLEAVSTVLACHAP